MRLVGATLVRNAADIVEAYVRHNLAFFDGLAIIDHGSSDGTSEILAALSAEKFPVFLARNETASFDQQGLMNQLVRHIFKTSDANWVFPLDSDEFIKVRSRSALESVLRNVSASGHLVLPWLTYVPRFEETADMLTLLRSALRVAEQRHGFAKVAVQRRFRTAKNQRLGKGSHTVEHLGMGDGEARSDGLLCSPEAAAIAHVPIRSAPQFVAKFASGWLGALASGKIVGEESFHWRQAYAHLRNGKPVTAAQLEAFAANYGVPQERWLPIQDIALIDDPFLAPVDLRHVRPQLKDPLPLVLTIAERLLCQRTPDFAPRAA